MQPWERDWSQSGSGASRAPWEREWAPAPEPAKRGIAAVANDTVIEAANAAAGAVSAGANFFSPGNRVSQYIDENIIKAGEEAQSDVAKASRRQFQEEVANADGFIGELGAVGRKIARDPLLTAAQAAGSFAVPGFAVKGAGMLARGAGATGAGIARAGLAGGAAAGAALAGGDAAGQAYQLAIEAGATEEQATAAARQASAVPAVVGGAGGLVGAERLLAGAGGMKGGIVARALKTAGVEGLQEGFEEGVTQYEGQRAAMPYDASIDPWKGVGAAAGMGAAMGGGIGAATGALTKPREPDPVTKGINEIAAAPTVDDAINAFADSVSGKPAAPTFGDRIASVKADASRETMAALREKYGPDSATEFLNSLAQAQNPRVPTEVREKHLQAVETMLFELRATREPEAPAPLALTGPDAQPAIGYDGAPPQLGMGSTPTGTMRVGPDGQAFPETAADVTAGRQDRMARDGLTAQAPQGGEPGAGVMVGDGTLTPGVARKEPVPQTAMAQALLPLRDRLEAMRKKEPDAPTPRPTAGPVATEVATPTRAAGASEPAGGGAVLPRVEQGQAGRVAGPAAAPVAGSGETVLVGAGASDAEQALTGAGITRQKAAEIRVLAQQVIDDPGAVSWQKARARGEIARADKLDELARTLDLTAKPYADMTPAEQSSFDAANGITPGRRAEVAKQLDAQNAAAPASQQPAASPGAAVGPGAAAPATPRVPKSFRKRHKVKTRVFDEETGALEEQESDADTALLAIQADISELRAFRLCLTGG